MIHTCTMHGTAPAVRWDDKEFHDCPQCGGLRKTPPRGLTDEEAAALCSSADAMAPPPLEDPDLCVHGNHPADGCADCAVEWPAHYNQGEIECIDAMVAAFGVEEVAIYAKIASFKYLWRANYKGKKEQDLAKASWYLRFAQGDDPRKDRK